MKKKILFLFIWVQALLGQEMPMLYKKNLKEAACSYEKKLVNHVEISLAKALKFTSKLNTSSFAEDKEIKIWSSDTPLDHLLNNLCNLPGASHLHVGLLRGGSFVAATYGNLDILREVIGLDWFQEYPRERFADNCSFYIDIDKCKIIDGGCFSVKKPLSSNPIDIYFYDADHSLLGHQSAFTYYDEVFADVFVAVVDDWKCPWVRRPTFKAFEKLGYQILYESFIPANEFYGHGQYVVVIKKKRTNNTSV